MPDWTYHPLGPIAYSVIGQHRSRLLALRLLAFLVIRLGGRRWIPWVFDHPQVPSDWRGRFGATVPVSVSREAIAVLPVQGASIIEVGPVTIADVEFVTAAARDGRCPVVAAADSAETAAALAAHGITASVGPNPEYVRLTDPDIRAAVSALTDSAVTVLAHPSVLTADGPSWFNRVIDAATPTSPAPDLRSIGANPLRWPGWFWGTLVGVGMIVAGLGAAAITLGPVLLWYDRNYLGATLSDLHAMDHHLVGFLQHDRITMAGNMIGLGILYIGLSYGGLRRGFRWARRVLAISGAMAFGTLGYFLGTGFVEPLHTLVVLVLLPMWLAAVWRAPTAAHWPPFTEGTDAERRRALWGQLLMIGIGGGLAVAGTVISTVGLSVVFVPTDLDFMGTTADHLHGANGHLLAFIAHDRAGFGGALIGSGLAVLLISMWGWRRGSGWVWWSLLLGCAFGTFPALAVHFTIGYLHFEHLLPVYVLVTATAAGLVLAKPYLTAG